MITKNMKKTARQKIESLGNIGIYVVRNGDLEGLRRYIEETDSGIFLANENSMIDTERIDTIEGGKAGRQSVNLETRSGNSEVLDLVRLMESKSDVTFFPGTLLRNFRGYVLPVMPIIQNGKIILERTKQTGIAYVDDYEELARTLIGEDYAKRSRGFSGIFSEEPMKSLQERLRTEVEARRKESFKTVNINGLRVLPVICNELSLIPELYEGKSVDVVIHSASCLFDDNENMKRRYEEVMRKMQEKGKINEPVVLAVAESRDNGLYKGILVYEDDKIRGEKLN